MNTRLTLLIAQIYVHIIFLIGLAIMPIHISIMALIVTHLIFVGLCGTVYYHRIVSHRNNIHPLLEKILMFISWLGASGSVIGWAATHRAHHRYSDTDRDPHNPRIHGIIKTYWWSSAGESSIRFVPDLLRNKLYLWQHKYYFIGLIIVHLLVGTLCDFSTYWLICIVPAFMMWFAGSMINILSHDSNGPRNNTTMAILFAGEGWHKNHHDTAASPKFGSKFDLGHRIYQIISFFSSQKNIH